jgi:L-ribulose-5-phosphate 4-epimerase
VEGRRAGSADATVPGLRRAVALGCRILAAEGHDDLVWGHVSARDPDDRGAWMKASGLGFDEVGGEDVVLVDRAGDVVEGAGTRHIEFPIHTEILAARRDVGAVVHTHAEHAVALAAAGEPLRPVSHAATLFVPPDVPRFTRTADLIKTPELGRAVAEALGPRDALFLVNHGLVTVGSDVPDAVVRAVILERACAIQLKVRGHGGWASWSSDEESLAKRESVYPRAARRQVWDYLARRVSSEHGRGR